MNKFEKPTALTSKEKQRMSECAEQLHKKESLRIGDESPEDYPVGKNLGEHREEIIKSNHPEYFNKDEK